jgi:hypothetical protein
MMEKKLHLLETFVVRGDDGNEYIVHGYEHLTRLSGMLNAEDQWEPTGLSEYKLASGERVDVDGAGVMRVSRTGVKLERKSVLQQLEGSKNQKSRARTRSTA